MKSEWQTKKIGEVVDIRRGSSPRPIHKFLASEGMPWVKIADATSDTSRYIWRTNEFIIDEGVNKSVKVVPETLIVSNSATPGLPKIMKITACVHDGWLVFFNYRGITRDFLYYKFVDIRHKLVNQANGSVFQNLKTDIVRDFDIDVPSIETQQKIVGILSNIDEKIELNNAINNNLEQQAVLLFRKWFTDFECVSENAIKTKFGTIPNTFKSLKTGELPVIVTDYVANGSFASLKANVTLYQEPNYAYFIRNTDLKSGTFEVFVDEHSYNFLSKSTLYGGEIIISNVGDVGSVFLCPKLNKPMTLGNNIIMLRPERANLQYYLYIWFKWLYGQSLIQGIKGGSAQPKFNKTDFKNLPIYLPPDDSLEHFHLSVKPMFELIAKNNVENQRLSALRDTLLPKLMSGELDVSDIEL